MEKKPYRFSEHSKFKRIWDAMTLDQKKKHIKKAGLEHILSRGSFAWNEIESNFQSKLRDVMRSKK